MNDVVDVDSFVNCDLFNSQENITIHNAAPGKKTTTYHEDQIEKKNNSKINQNVNMGIPLL